MACAMVYWGENYNIFIEYGAVADLSGLIGAEIGPTKSQMKLQF